MPTDSPPSSANWRGVILDEASFNHDDLDLSRLLGTLGHWQRFDASSPGEALTRVADADVIVANKVRFDPALIDAAPRLKAICLTATGTDNVDLAHCAQKGIAVKNVTDYGTAAVAQHAMTLMLALSTKLLDYHATARSGAWSQSPHFCPLSFPISELDGKTLGLVGYGTLAKGVEKRARAFGMDILIANRPGGQPQPGRLDLAELLPKVDFLSLHCPLTDTTRHLIDAKALSQMKPGAFLLNTARGAVVDNAALAAALKNGVIAGAGIDVLEQEPPPADHPLLATDIPNLILTPHIAWAAVEARQRLLDKVADNVMEVIREAG